jgi:antitoxin MazE
MAATIEKTSKVSRWGNSLGLRIPQEGVDQLRLKDGETVKIQIKGDSITIKRTKPRKKWTEAELLKGVTPDMCGPEFFAVPVGKEVL